MSGKKKRLVLPVSLSASARAREEAGRVAALAKQEASDTAAVMSAGKSDSGKGDTPLTSLERLKRRKSVSPARADVSSEKKLHQPPTFASAVTKGMKDLEADDERVSADEAAAIQVAKDASLAGEMAARDSDAKTAIQSAREKSIADQLKFEEMEKQLIQQNADELQRTREFDAREKALKDRLEELRFELETAQAKKLSEQNDREHGAYGEEKLSSPLRDANAGLPQSAGTGGGKPPSHHEEPLVTAGSGDAKTHSSGKSNLEKDIRLPPTDEAADETPKSGEYIRSLATEISGEKRRLLQPGFSFHSQFGSITRNDCMEVYRYYTTHYPDIDPDSFSQIVDHIISKNEYSVGIATFLGEVCEIFYDRDAKVPQTLYFLGF